MTAPSILPVTDPITNKLIASKTKTFLEETGDTNVVITGIGYFVDEKTDEVTVYWATASTDCAVATVEVVIFADDTSTIVER
jgi:hypothetical protein